MPKEEPPVAEIQSGSAAGAALKSGEATVVGDVDPVGKHLRGGQRGLEVED